MRIIAILAAASAFLFSLSADAQNYPVSSIASTAKDVYASCVSISRKQGAADPRAACACVSGYMGGALSNRDYEAASALLRISNVSINGGSQQAIEAELRALFERGFTEADVKRATSNFEQVSAISSAVCNQFE